MSPFFLLDVTSQILHRSISMKLMMFLLICTPKGSKLAPKARLCETWRAAVLPCETGMSWGGAQPGQGTSCLGATDQQRPGPNLALTAVVPLEPAMPDGCQHLPWSIFGGWKTSLFLPFIDPAFQSTFFPPLHS